MGASICELLYETFIWELLYVYKETRIEKLLQRDSYTEARIERLSQRGSYRDARMERLLQSSSYR